MEEKRRNRYHSLYRRAFYSVVLVASVLIIGTIGFHYIENYSYIDSFYFISMLATAQGPASTPATSLGKIFASIMAFVSVGTVVVATVFLLGPFLRKVVRTEEERLKDEEGILMKDIKKYEKKI